MTAASGVEGPGAGPSRLHRLAAPSMAALVIAVLATAVGFGAPRVLKPLGWLENLSADLRVVAFAPDAAPRTDIAVLGIDEATLDQLPYRSPVDRSFLADILDRLAVMEVRAVAFDMLFDRATEPEKDAAFREALLAFPKPVVVAWSDVDGAVTAQQKAFMQEYMSGLPRGYAYMTRDGIDGTVRWINIVHHGEEVLPGLAAAVAREIGVPVPHDDIPLDYLVAEDPRQSVIPVYPAHLMSILPASFFAGKTVFVGGVLREVDRLRTPLAGALGAEDGVIPGVLIHAQALAQLVDGRRFESAGPTGELAIVVLAVLLGFILAAIDMPVWMLVGAAALALANIVGTIAGAYALTGYMLPLVSPLLGFLVAVPMSSFNQQRRYHGERAFIRGALSRYVAEDVVKQLEHEPWRLKLGGERRELSFLFTDIAGFTSLSEQTEPAVLVAALNRYLDGASRVVLDHHGVIDKFIGDAVVAVFGAFATDRNHSQDAVACALALDNFARTFAAEQHAHGLAFGHTRIGVNTGSAIIGNFGGDLRFDFTSIGDAVNTAARLEGANKYFGTRICVSGSARSACTDGVFRPIGEIVLAGKNDSVPVFEPLHDGDPQFAAADGYRAAYDLMAAGDPRARSAFADLAARQPTTDSLIVFHLARLEAGETGARIVLDGK